jgi:xanthine dehydrogenase accessory factor
VGDWNFLIDPMRKLKTLYLFGGGHVAVPTVHIAAMAGFRVVVVDDRLDYANRSVFPMPG